MRQKSHSTDLSSEEIVKRIRRATRKHYSAEDKIRIVRAEEVRRLRHDAR